MASWLIISLVLFGLLVLLFKTMNHVWLLSMVKDNFFYFFAILFFIFLAISLTHIHNNYDVDLTSFKGIVTASKIYYGWFLNVMGNLGKVTGYAIRQDWFTASENSTNSTNSTSYGG